MATDADTPERSDVVDVTAVLELLRKPRMAELYTRLRREPATVPELLAELDLGKTAAYDYCNRLQAAGLVTEAGTENGSTRYEAREFSVTVHIGDLKVSITPDLARVLAERTESSEIDRFVDQYGVETLAELLPLARQYADGATTHRAVAERLGISRAAAFEMLGEVLDVLGETPESKHSRPDEASDGAVATIVEDARPSE